MLKTIREGEETARQRGLFWAGMWKQQNAARRGNKGDVDSVALTTALGGDQVKEGGTAPEDCFKEERTERESGGND